MNDILLENRLRRVESGLDDIPTFQAPATDDDYRVKPVYKIEAVSASIAARLTRVELTWIGIEDPNLARYEIYVSRIANSAEQPYLAASVTDSPAVFNVVSDAAGYGIALIRTVMKNGLITPLTASPSVVFQVF